MEIRCWRMDSYPVLLGCLLVSGHFQAPVPANYFCCCPVASRIALGQVHAPHTSLEYVNGWLQHPGVGCLLMAQGAQVSLKSDLGVISLKALGEEASVRTCPPWPA